VFIDDFATGLDTLDLSAYGASDAYDVYLQHQDDPSWWLHLAVGGTYLNAPRILNGIPDEITGSVSVIRVLGFTNGLVDAEQLVSISVDGPWAISDIVI
jgi:hypothetical protein